MKLIKKNKNNNNIMIVVVVCCDADDIFGGKIKAMDHFLTASFYRRMVVDDHYLLVGSILGLECIIYIYIYYTGARAHTKHNRMPWWRRKTANNVEGQQGVKSIVKGAACVFYYYVTFI